MAWDWAAYAVTLAVLTVAAACVFGITRISRSLRRLDRTVANVSKEAEATLRECRQLAEEARKAIVVSRQSLQGFATLAEGARALGEAVQTAAQTAVHVTEVYRECLTASCRALSTADDCQSPAAGETISLADIGRSLWSLWKRHVSPTDSSAVNCKSPGPGADPSEGE